MGRSSTFDALVTARALDLPSVAVQYASIAEGLALADRSNRGTVVALGSEVVPLLQGVVTSDVFALAEPGSGQHSCAVNAKGRMLCDLRLLHGPEILLMDFEPGLVEDGIVSHFRANVMSEDAKFIDRSGSTSIIGVYGPSALEVVGSLGPFERDPTALPVYDGTWGDIDVVVRRTELGVDLITALEDAAPLWARLESLGAVPVGTEALEIHRVEHGIPRWGAELDEKVIPLEAGLDAAVSFNKGCYVGQEIIARLDTLGTPARLLRRLVLAGPAAPGDVLYDDDQKVGELRTVVDSPRIGGPLALAYLKRNHTGVGHTVRVGDVEARVEALRP